MLSLQVRQFIFDLLLFYSISCRFLLGSRTRVRNLTLFIAFFSFFFILSKELVSCYYFTVQKYSFFFRKILL